MKIQPYWLMQAHAAKSCGVALNTFKNWNVQPIHIENGKKYFTFKEIAEARALIEKHSKADTLTLPTGEKINYSVELARKTQQERIKLELLNEKTKETQIAVEVLEDCLTKVAEQQAAIFDSLPLNIKRRVPDIKASVLELVKKEIVKLQNSLADMQVWK